MVALPAIRVITKQLKEKREKRCRNGVPKSTQTRKDKSDGNGDTAYLWGSYMAFA